MFPRRIMPDDALPDSATEASGSIFAIFLAMLGPLAPAEFWFMENDDRARGKDDNDAGVPVERTEA